MDCEKIARLHGENRVWLHQEVPLPQPKAVFLEPSTYCNFHCCYCTHFMSKEQFEREVRPYENMELAVVERVVKDLESFPEPVNLVEFSGMGEPLVNSAIAEMVRRVKQSGRAAHIRLITNGVLLTPAMSDALIAAGVDTVRISMQGLSQRSYEKICGVRQNFEEIVSNIRYFYEHRGHAKIFVKNVNLALEAGEDARFYQLFADCCDRMYIENVIPFFSKVDYDQLLPTSEENRYHMEKREVTICPNTFTGLTLNVRGEISMCGKEIGPCYLGNIHEITLPEAWNSEKRRDFLLLQLHKKRWENPICRECQIPSESLASERDLLDPYAEEMIKRFERLNPDGRG